jgi:hypothetical protein
MNEDEKRSNSRTMIFCKFLQESGIPSSGDVGSLEHASLQWIKKIRQDCNNLLASDLNIIRSHGLFSKIFVDQARQNKVEELERQMVQLAHQLKVIKEGVTSDHSAPKVSVKINVNKNVSQNQIRFTSAYKANRKKYRMKLLKAISESKDGLSRGEMYIVLGGHASASVLQDCINFLEKKNLIYLKSFEKSSGRGSRTVQHWDVVDRNMKTKKEESVAVNERVVQRQLFDINESEKKKYKPNPACVWAKDLGVFSTRLQEADLIGYAKIRSKKDDTIKDCGLENYCIYPSGMIKYYLRFRSFDGTFGYSFRRWSTSKDLLEINLKKEFDFCNK